MSGTRIVFFLATLALIMTSVVNGTRDDNDDQHRKPHSGYYNAEDGEDLEGSRTDLPVSDAQVSVVRENTKVPEKPHRRVRIPSSNTLHLPGLAHFNENELASLMTDFLPKSVIDYGNWCGPGHGGYQDCCDGKPCPSCDPKRAHLTHACLNECPVKDGLDLACARHDTCVYRHHTIAEIHSRCSGNYCACDCALTSAAESHHCRDLHCHIYRQGVIDIFEEAVHCWYYEAPTSDNHLPRPVCNYMQEKDGSVVRYNVTQFCDTKGRLECVPFGACYDELHEHDAEGHNVVHPHPVYSMKTRNGCSCKNRHCVPRHEGSSDGKCEVVEGSCPKDADVGTHDDCVLDPCHGMECPPNAYCKPEEGIDGMTCKISCRDGYDYQPAAPSPCVAKNE